MNTHANVSQLDGSPSAKTLNRASLPTQVAVVGAASMTLAGFFLLATIVLVLSLWIPAWIATLAVAVALTAVSLAVFASANPHSRLRNFGYELQHSYVSLDSNEREPTRSRSPSIEEAELEEATLEDDEQETTAVRQVDALLDRRQRGHQASVRPTEPMFARSTRQSYAR